MEKQSPGDLVVKDSVLSLQWLGLLLWLGFDRWSWELLHAVGAAKKKKKKKKKMEGILNPPILFQRKGGG